MITKRELLEAIAECEEEPPSFTSIKKLASLYTVYDHLYGKEPEEKPHTATHSEFLQVAEEKDRGAVLEVFDELMQSLKVIYPKVYESVMRKVRQIK